MEIGRWRRRVLIANMNGRDGNSEVVVVVGRGWSEWYSVMHRVNFEAKYFEKSAYCMTKICYLEVHFLRR